jgi:hypothetical protein
LLTFSVSSFDNEKKGSTNILIEEGVEAREGKEDVEKKINFSTPLRGI